VQSFLRRQQHSSEPGLSSPWARELSGKIVGHRLQRTEVVQLSELDPEEKEILKAFETGESKHVNDADDLLRRHKGYAQAAFRKTNGRLRENG
jgi:hypothetical protein